MMVNNMLRIEEINNYINIEKKKINNKYRLKYHMMPPVGWMNDPNGLVYFNNAFHLYYQYNPYNTLPGTMLWGHFESNDLIMYKDKDVAIIPSKEHASIFSGGAIESGNLVNALYTLHYEYEGNKSEDIYLATSKDGNTFVNHKCVFDNELLPDNICRVDFRDPCPVKINDTFYVFVGGKDKKLNKGVIIVLKGNSLENLEYFFTIGPLYELGDMGECPSYARVGEKDVLIASGCRVAPLDNNFKNENSSVFIVGNLDFVKGKFDIDFIKEIDKGDTFYAPQFIRGTNEPIMIGWLEMWGKQYPTHEWKHGYSGALSIPRKLSYRNNDIYQEPIDSLKNYHKEANDKLSKCLDISFVLEDKGEFMIDSLNGKLVIGLDEYVYLDTTDSNNLNGCIRRSNNKYENCQIRVLFDVSSVELFISNGKETISSRIYLDGTYKVKINEYVNDLKIREIGDVNYEE